MCKRASLLLVLLVAVALATSGCLEGFFGEISSERDEVNVVVNAFMDAFEAADEGNTMASLLASTVTSVNRIDWIGVDDGIYEADEFVETWTDLQLPLDFVDWSDEPEDIDRGITVSGLRFVEGPRTTVSGDYAISTGKIMLDLDHPAEWFDDISGLLNGDRGSTVGSACTISDIYTVRLELVEIESDWKITCFMVEGSESQTSILAAWDSFSRALTGIDVWTDEPDDIDTQIDAALSVCTDPFFWDGLYGGSNVVLGISTHYEWREALMLLFGPNDNYYSRYLALELCDPVPIELKALSGTIRARVRAYVGEFLLSESGGSDLVGTYDESGIVELTVVFDGGRWLLSGVSNQSFTAYI